MIPKEAVVKYNGELKEGLTEMWNAINKGQQKKILKEHPKVKALLDRFHIKYEV